MSVKQRIARALSMEDYVQGLARDGLEELIVMARGRLVELNEEAAQREWGALAAAPCDEGESAEARP